MAVAKKGKFASAAKRGMKKASEEPDEPTLQTIVEVVVDDVVWIVRRCAAAIIQMDNLSTSQYERATIRFPDDYVGAKPSLSLYELLPFNGLPAIVRGAALDMATRLWAAKRKEDEVKRLKDAEEAAFQYKRSPYGYGHNTYDDGY